MIDKNDLKTLRLKISEFDQRRDIVIKQSRDIVRDSKTVIYAVHRGDLDKAAQVIDVMTAKLKELDGVAKSHPKLWVGGSYKVAVQEYVEAIAFYSIVKDDRLPTSDELSVEPEHYLLGVFDLAGEISRKAINSVIEGDTDTAIKLKDFLSELYGELMQFDFSGGELRKKFDAIKYELKKLEDLVLQLTLKGG